jgi:hypothetical protein
VSSSLGPVHCRLRFERKSFVHRNLVFCFDSIPSTRFLQRSRIYLPPFIQGSYPHEMRFGSNVPLWKFAEIGSFYARVEHDLSSNKPLRLYVDSFWKGIHISGVRVRDSEDNADSAIGRRQPDYIFPLRLEGILCGDLSMESNEQSFGLGILTNELCKIRYRQIFNQSAAILHGGTLALFGSKSGMTTYSNCLNLPSRVRQVLPGDPIHRTIFSSLHLRRLSTPRCDEISFNIQMRSLPEYSSLHRRSETGQAPNLGQAGAIVLLS